ncbi:hypothetical protein J2Y03_004742 [Neobacillus niacini]|uniref:hypothetical protein n=1 Tax=Neobacillus niacini TaxID=86668 RepID=UPI0028634F8F|nr:hypothetical protein [Neobacillus niacini]MDR7079684.1 hypothetical protein [Neobacillus niacini]
MVENGLSIFSRWFKEKREKALNNEEESFEIEMDPYEKMWSELNANAEAKIAERKAKENNEKEDRKRIEEARNKAYNPGWKPTELNLKSRTPIRVYETRSGFVKKEYDIADQGQYVVSLTANGKMVAAYSGKTMLEASANAIRGEDYYKTKIRIIRPQPRIGMKADEIVKLSTLGEPDNIKRTTTQNGVSEIWIYRNNLNFYGYIYLTNGVVTAIEENY